MGRLGCYFTLALMGGTFFGFVRGSSELYTAITNRAPTEIAIAEYVETRPSAKWLTLTNARISLLRGSYSSNRGKVKEVYIPILPADEEDATPVVLLQTKRPHLLNLAQKMSALKGDGEALMFAAKNYEAMNLGDTATGLRGQFGDIDDDTRNQLQQLNPAIGKDFVIILDGAEPSLGKGLGLLVVGIGCLAVLILLFLSKANEPEAPSASVVPQGAGTAGPPPLPTKTS